MLRFEDLRVRDQQSLDPDFFNRRFRLITETLAQLNEAVAGVTQDTDRLVALGLNRVNEVLGPLLERVLAVSGTGFLVANSATSVQLSPNLETAFQITNSAQRELFTPTPYILLQRTSNNTLEDYAAAQVLFYERATGIISVKIVDIQGNIANGQYDDWVISATAGISKKTIEASLQAQILLSEVQQIVVDVQTSLDAVNALLASAIVTSVNGKTGVVALSMTDIPNLVSSIGAKADSNHGHTIAQVSNLQSALDGKAASVHGHAIADVTGLQTALDGKQAAGSYAAASHTHTTAQVTGLDTALAGKAASVHTHVIADTSGLQTALDGKQPLDADLTAIAALTGTTGLLRKSALNTWLLDTASYAAVVHAHAIADVTGLQTALDGKAATAHSHTIANVTGLQSALDGKTNVGHAHAISDVTGLQAALDQIANGSINALDGGTY